MGLSLSLNGYWVYGGVVMVFSLVPEVVCLDRFPSGPAL